MYFRSEIFAMQAWLKEDLHGFWCNASHVDPELLGPEPRLNPLPYFKNSCIAAQIDADSRNTPRSSK